jgi:hypothetical protein
MRVDVIEHILARDATTRAGAVQRSDIDAVFVHESTHNG